jgi:hypothetical protein
MAATRTHDAIDNSWKVFVSYSRNDRNIVSPVVDLLRVTGSRVFRDEDSIRPGEKWRLAITESLRAAKTCVVFWCIHSAKSEEVRREYRTAIELEKEVVPVLLDNTKLVDDLRSYQAVDLRVYTEAHDARSARVAAGVSTGAIVGGVTCGVTTGLLAPSLLMIGAVGVIGALFGATAARFVTASSTKAPVELSEYDRACIAAKLYNRIVGDEYQPSEGRQSGSVDGGDGTSCVEEITSFYKASATESPYSVGGWLSTLRGTVFGVSDASSSGSGSHSHHGDYRDDGGGGDY